MTAKFGKYELGERIASGGMAEVFRARVRGPDGFVKEVCIKRILPHHSEDPEFVEMFVSEARVAAQLHHANVVQIFDFDVVDGAYYMAMEWVDGVDLRRLLHRARTAGSRMPVEVAVFVATEMLKGLRYAHGRRWEGRPLGLVHRDVSPHNVLVSNEGEVKLADFGIAKAASRASATRTGVVKGKLPYMAPEQARGAGVDVRADVWATGIVLYEMLAGVRPFTADSDAELLAAILHAPVPPVRSRRDDVPEAAESILGRLLAREPEDRFQTAGEALRALATHAPPDGSIRLADFLSALLAAPAASARGARDPTMRLGAPTASAGVETPPVPAMAPDAATRTRKGRDGVEALPYAPTAVARTGEEPAPTLVSGGEPTLLSGGEPALATTRVDTATSATPAPVSRSSALETIGPTGTAAGARAGRRFAPVALALLVVGGVGAWIAASSGSDPPPAAVGGMVSPSAGNPAADGESAQTVLPATVAPIVLPGPSAAPHPAPESARAPSSAAPAGRVAGRGTGSIFVGARPWAMVEWRGQSLGQTPRTIEDVPAGSHTVVLVGPDGARKTVRVTVRPGKTVQRVVPFE